MKLYYSNGAWQLPGKQSKGAVKIDVPTAAPDLAQFLNDRNVRPDPLEKTEQGLTMVEIEFDEPEIDDAFLQADVSRYERSKYVSPMDARTSLAMIDAGLCASAIRQLYGPELVRVGKAYTERLDELAAAYERTMS